MAYSESCSTILGLPDVPDEKYMSMGSAASVSRRAKSSEAARTPVLKPSQPSRSTGAAHTPSGPESAAPSGSPSSGNTRLPSASSGVSPPPAPFTRMRHLQRGARVGHVVHHVGDGAERRGDDGLDGRAVQAVLQIVLLEHERGGHHDRAELRERRGHEPELVVAAQDDHDHVAAADALRGQEVRRLVRPALHVGEREHVLLALRVAPHHGAAVGVCGGDVVHHVVAEVEIVGTIDGEIS